ncbi:MAG: hypothetical protein IJK02_08535 [Clostridia bacterium]|nr:hypothetical protein [Clostridia bacterium]MBR0509608.1 hypothetical protein [Clostridia bacterium]MBR0536708.1 hypothetical protein [Clostridia bacterium]
MDRHQSRTKLLILCFLLALPVSLAVSQIVFLRVFVAWTNMAAYVLCIL